MPYWSQPIQFPLQFHQKSVTSPSDAGNTEVSSTNTLFFFSSLVSEKKKWSDRERGRTAVQPTLLLGLYYGWIPTLYKKGWSRRTPLIRLDQSAAKWVPRNPPPQYGRLTERGKDGGEGRRTQRSSVFPPAAVKAPAHSPPQHVSACVPASPATHREPQNQVLQPERASPPAVRTLLYLLGAGACTEKLLAVFPAALEGRLGVGVGVVAEQVLLQVLHHPEHQRAAVPLQTQDTACNKLISLESMCQEV